jgi:hypothetical protein
MTCASDRSPRPKITTVKEGKDKEDLRYAAAHAVALEKITPVSVAQPQQENLEPFLDGHTNILSSAIRLESQSDKSTGLPTDLVPNHRNRPDVFATIRGAFYGVALFPAKRSVASPGMERAGR